MSSTLFIRLSGANATQAQWIESDALNNPEPQISEGTLEDAAIAAAGLRVICIVPSTDIHLTQTNIPSRNRTRIAEAVPYALENEFAGEVESQHFSVGSQNSDSNDVPVVIVAKNKMTEWVEKLTLAGIQAQAICPDVLCLPHEDTETWHGLIEAQTAIVRTGEASGFAVDADNLQWLLSASLTECDKNNLPAKIKLADFSEQAIDCQLIAEKINTEETEVEAISSEGHVLAYLAENYAEENAINLLQGEYKTDQKYLQKLRPWIPAAAVLGALILVAFASNLVEYFSLKQQDQQLAKQIETVFRETFPESTRFHQPKERMRQKLNTLRALHGQNQQGFLSLLADISGPLKAEAGLVISSISYRDGQFDLRLNLRNLESLEHLKTSLASEKLKVEIKSASAENQIVSAHLRISGGKS